MSNMVDQVIADARAEWEQVDHSTIVPEWWQTLLGYVPEDAKAIDDQTVLVLAVLYLQGQLAQFQEVPNHPSAVNGGLAR